MNNTAWTVVRDDGVAGSNPATPTSIRTDSRTVSSKVPTLFAPSRCIHFVGFRGDEYWSAVKAFGRPDFIHRGWDLRAQREIADDDLVVFASGPDNQQPRVKSFDDIRERE